MFVFISEMHKMQLTVQVLHGARNTNVKQLHVPQKG